MKQHRDFVVLVKNGIEINALVAVSRMVYTPATQTTEAFSIEHLTVVSLDPAAQGPAMSGEQLRNSIKVDFDVAPWGEGVHFGWKETADDAELERTKALLAEAEDLITEYKNVQPTPPAAPSAADLDAVAAEEAAKAATSAPAPEVPLVDVVNIDPAIIDAAAEAANLP